MYYVRVPTILLQNIQTNEGGAPVDPEASPCLGRIHWETSRSPIIIATAMLARNNKRQCVVDCFAMIALIRRYCFQELKRGKQVIPYANATSVSTEENACFVTILMRSIALKSVVRTCGEVEFSFVPCNSGTINDERASIR